MSAWQEKLLDRLIALRSPAGAWGYKAGAAPSPEPTSLACLALTAAAGDPPRLEPALSYLVGAQRADGRVPASPAAPRAAWPTGLAVLAWSTADQRRNDCHGAAARAVRWLLGMSGRTFDSNPRIYGHDTKLVGWPWIEDTHTWLEPTAYALMALQATGQSQGPRFRDALQVLMDRAIEGGGWNYGNGRMFGADLRPFPETTGIVLTALAGEPMSPPIEAGLRYLSGSFPEVRSPIGLAWSVIGLEAWRRRPADADDSLQRGAEICLRSASGVIEPALLLIAATTPCVLNQVVSGNGAEIASIHELAPG